MQSLSRATARYFAPLAVLVAAACTEKVFVPVQQGVQLNLVLASQVAGASRSVTVKVRYETSSGSLVSLHEQVTTVAVGTQQLSVPVDLAKCLGDAAHVGGASACRLRVLVELRDASSGTLLDSVELPAITAAPGSVSPATSVTVAAVNTIVVSGIPSSISAGQTAQATAVVRDASGNTLARAVNWVSSNAAIASVNGTTGQITAVAPGTVQITATSGGVSQNTTLTVVAAVASVSVNPSSAQLTVGQTTQIVVTLRDANNNVLTGRPITYSSSASSVASVSGTGLISAVAAGSAVITVTSEGRTATVSVGVNNAPLVTVTPSSMSAVHTVGQTSCPQVVGTVSIANNSGADVNFSANVSNSALTLSAAGSPASGSISGGMAAGATAQIQVRFTCSTTQSFQGTVTVVARNLANTVVETYNVAVTLSISP